MKRAMQSDKGREDHCWNHININTDTSRAGKGQGGIRTPENTDGAVNITETARGREELARTGDSLGETGNNICSKVLLGSKCANLIKAFSASLWWVFFFLFCFFFAPFFHLDHHSYRSQLIGASGTSC